MASIAVTYTFSNSTTADATQVNQNYTDIVNGLSDGTKDLSVNAGTFAGNVSISGNTTIGNATGDDLTVTASLASSITIKTTNSFDIGTSSIGLRALYFGANSQTVNIKASSSMSATWTFTLPVSAGTSSYILQTDGSGVSSWVSRTVESVVSKTTTYVATSSDDVILASTSGGNWTLTLPAAASNTGKILKIKKTNSDANVLIIDGNASETIDGQQNLKLSYQNDFVQIISDGSNWLIDAESIRHAARLTKVSQTLTASATTTITYDTVDYDNLGLISSGVFTPLRSGTYKIDASVNISSQGSGATRIIYQFDKNAGTLITRDVSTNVTAGNSYHLSDTIFLAAGDALRFQINTDATGSITISSEAPRNYMSVMRVGN